MPIAAEAQHDDLLYCMDIVIQVENIIFRVPKRIFDESPIFRDMYMVPQGSEEVDGSSDERPLVLNGISAADFRHMVFYLFPQTAWPAPSAEYWAGVLRLSKLWEIPRAASDASNALESLVTSPARRIQLAREFNIPGWQISAFEDLIKSDSQLTMEDAQMLGIESVLRVTHLRERYGYIIRNTVGDMAMVQIARLQEHQNNLEKLQEVTETAISRCDHVIDDLREKYRSAQGLPYGWGSRQYNISEGQTRSIESRNHSLVAELKSDIETLSAARNKAPLTRAIIREHFDLTDDD